MSGTALRDLNVLPTSGLPEKKSDSSSKGGFTKPDNGNMRQNKVSASLLSSPVKELDLGDNGVANAEVEYIESENLPDLPSVDTSLNVGLFPFCLASYFNVFYVEDMFQVARYLFHTNWSNDFLILHLLVVSCRHC